MLTIPTFVLVSALILCSTLTGVVRAAPQTSCVEQYRVGAGDTCTSIAQLGGTSQSGIQSMNPTIDCNGALTPGTVICTRQYTPTCTLNKTATSTTCDGLATTWNITVADFIQYNEDINSDCSNLVVGDTYCVSIQGCYPGNTAGICQQR